MELKGSKTEKNLMAAFAGESEARNKYTYYASKAKKDGYVQIAQLFEETAANEKEHAKIWFKILHGGAVGGTAENLQDAAARAKTTNGRICTTTFAKEARRRGVPSELQLCSKQLAAIEKEHEERYRKLLANVEGGLVFSRDEDQIWQCSKLRPHRGGQKSAGSLSACAAIRRLISRSKRKTIDHIDSYGGASCWKLRFFYAFFARFTQLLFGFIINNILKIVGKEPNERKRGYYGESRYAGTIPKNDRNAHPPVGAYPGHSHHD